MALVEVSSLSRRYGPGDDGRRALDDLSFQLDEGELVAIEGASGSGKSTLLNVLGALDRAYTGSCKIEGRELRSLGDRDAAALRQTRLGFVFQAFHLVAGWSVADNVALPASFAAAPVDDLAERVRETLARVGLGGRENDLPTSLSGGQRQRVAIARALLLKPKILLCDEPTGSLDHATGASVLSLFQGLFREGGVTLVMVTHEQRVTDIATRVLKLDQGRLVDDVKKG